jgi:hypothetical protein
MCAPGFGFIYDYNIFPGVITDNRFYSLDVKQYPTLGVYRPSVRDMENMLCVIDEGIMISFICVYSRTYIMITISIRHAYIIQYAHVIVSTQTTMATSFRRVYKIYS